MSDGTHTPSPAPPTSDSLLGTVVEGGYCVGCGACASVPGSGLGMALNERGMYEPRPTGDPGSTSIPLPQLCPFGHEAENEDTLGERLFGKDCERDDRIGYHLATYAGHVEEDAFRASGSSGGMGNWVLCELLDKGLIDAAIHIRARTPTDDDPRMFSFGVSTTREEITGRAKSRYYPVEMSGVLEHIRTNPGRYAIVGLPCFLKAVRLRAHLDPVIGERVAFCVGLVCGHLKSAAFATFLAWQAGVEPDELVAFDFRRKLPDRPANLYGIEAYDHPPSEGPGVVKPNDQMYGTDWGMGMFKYKACDYCDDVLAELADITVGDAWLGRYLPDSKGTNVVVVRNPTVHDLVEQARGEGRLVLDDIGPDAVARSQDAGLRHRREGLAYRLSLADEAGEWRPPKRVEPDATGLTPKQREIQRMRIEISRTSHDAFARALQSGRLEVFMELMNPLVDRYRSLYKPSARTLMVLHAKRMARRALRAVGIR